MKAYMAYCGDKDNGACLVFAETARSARLVAWPTIRGWFDAEWIDLRVKMLRSTDWILGQAISGKPHVIECPKGCSSCFMWGEDPPSDEGCRFCLGERWPT